MIDPKDLQHLASNADQLTGYDTARKMTWCSNCGNYGIQNALKRALVLEGIDRNNFILCFDVGCNGNGSDKFEANTIHGLHGRVISLAAGVKLANHNMHVIASAGDGATFSEGVGHLVHAVRNDFPIVFIHHNNENYGLTTGQASSCTPKGVKMNASPYGTTVEPINTLDFVLSLNPTFVARGYSGEVDQMTNLLRAALNHNGFAFVEILQACPTYNRETPDEWYAERVNDVSANKDYDPSDIWAARKLVEFGDPNNVPTGIIYHNPRPEGYIEKLAGRENAKTTLIEEVKNYDISKLIK